MGTGAPVVVRYGAAPDQFAEWRAPGGARPWPVAVLLHGGYWRDRYGRDLMRPLATDLAARGIGAWNVEYRRIGTPGGGWPGTFADVAAAIDALAEHASRLSLDLGRVATVGHSAGGQLALWLAARDALGAGRTTQLAGAGETTEVAGAGGMPGGAARARPAAVVALAGLCDLVAAHRLRLSDDAVAALLGGTEAAHPERYRLASPAARVPLGVRQLLVHGTADADVPLSQSTGYAAAAAAAGDDCTLRVLTGVDHFALIDPASAAWDLAAHWLEDALLR